MEIYLDACIAIYLVEEYPVYAPLVAARLRGGVGCIAYSPLMEMECLVLPMRQQRIELAKLRARHGIKTPDALHLAPCNRNALRLPQFWTNDDRLNKVAEKMAVNVLSHAAP